MNKTIPSIIERVLEAFDENVAPMITDYGGISEDPVLEKYIKDFISSALTSAIEEVGNEVIGPQEKIREESLRTVDGSYDFTTDIVVSRNYLRTQQRKKLSKLLKRHGNS